jgi:hypothetical protein
MALDPSMLQFMTKLPLCTMQPCICTMPSGYRRTTPTRCLGLTTHNGLGTSNRPRRPLIPGENSRELGAVTTAEITTEGIFRPSSDWNEKGIR